MDTYHLEPSCGLGDITLPVGSMERTDGPSYLRALQDIAGGGGWTMGQDTELDGLRKTVRQGRGFSSFDARKTHAVFTRLDAAKTLVQADCCALPKEWPACLDARARLRGVMKKPLAR